MTTVITKGVRGFLDYLSKEADRVSVKNLLGVLQQNTEARLLDLGCSNGTLTMQLAERVGTSNVWGVEFHQDRVKEAQGRGIQVMQGNLNEGIPFKSESFDVVVSSWILGSIWNIDNFLRETHRVLRLGGYTAILQANLASLHNVAYLLLGLKPLGAVASNEGQVGNWSPLRNEGQSPSHPGALTMAGLNGLLARHHFGLERAIGVGYYPLFGILARAATTVVRRHASWMVITARKVEE